MGALPDTIPAFVDQLGLPAGASGSPGSMGWELRVKSAADFKTILAVVPRFTSLQFSAMINNQGSGTAAMNRDDPIFRARTVYPGSYDVTLAGSSLSANYMLLAAADAGYLQPTWTFTVIGTPANGTYFTITAAQAASTIKNGDTFTDANNPGVVFTVQSMTPSGGNVNVNFTPTAATIMSNPDVVQLSPTQTFTIATGAAAGSTVYKVTGISDFLVPQPVVRQQLAVFFSPNAPHAMSAGDVIVVSGYPGTGLLDRETLWEVSHDGQLVFDFLCETVTEQLVDQSEQRIATVTGPGTAAALGWGAAMPPGWPFPIYRTDGIQDPFSEVNSQGQLTIDAALWNLTTGGGKVFINPSGTVEIRADSSSPVLGGGPFWLTTISAAISPVGLPSGGALNGTQITQMYVESTDGTGGYALIGLTASGLYAQVKDAEGNVFTKVLGAYDSTNEVYWRIQFSPFQGGKGGAGVGAGPIVLAGGTLTFWTSADATTWVEKWSFTPNAMWNFQSVDLFFAAFYSGSGVFATVSNINQDVLFPTSLGPIFIAEPIMQVWLTLLRACQGRGTIPWVAPTFTAALDSGQDPWQDSQSVQVPMGTDLYTMLTNSAGAIAADWRMRPGGRLDVGLTGSIGRHLEGKIVFHDGGQNMVRQDVRARNAIANMVAGEDESGFIWTQINNQSISLWAQREQFITAASSLDGPTTSLIVGASLAQSENEVPSRTLQIEPNVPGRTIFRDFQPGDWVGLEHSDQSYIEPVRVIAIAVSIDQAGVETHELTLMTYRQWIDEQLTELVNALGGSFASTLGALPPGTSVFGGGSIFPSRVQPITHQAQTPKLAQLADVVIPPGTIPVPSQVMQVNPDGATFSPATITARGLGGMTVTIAATAPASPIRGDLWFDTAAGNQLYQFNGTSWVLYQFGTAAISAGSITAALIAAGVIVAGIVDGTTITGSTIVAEGTGYLGYNGAPAFNNLVFSATAAAGTDSQGNKYLAGTTVYGPIGSHMAALQITDASVTWYTATNEGGPWTSIGSVYPDSSSNLHVDAVNNVVLRAGINSGEPTALNLTSGGLASITNPDQNTYLLGILTARTTADTLFNSSVPKAIPGMVVTVQPGVYEFEAWIDETADTSTYLSYFFLTGTAGASVMRAWINWLPNNSPPTYKVQTNFGDNTGVNSSQIAGVNYGVIMRGSITVSSAGTLQVAGATSGGDGFHVHIRSSLRVWPST